MQELECQLRDKQVENMYLKGEVSGLKTHLQPSLVSQKDKDIN